MRFMLGTVFPLSASDNDLGSESQPWTGNGQGPPQTRFSFRWRTMRYRKWTLWGFWYREVTLALPYISQFVERAVKCDRQLNSQRYFVLALRTRSISRHLDSKYPELGPETWCRHAWQGRHFEPRSAFFWLPPLLMIWLASNRLFVHTRASLLEAHLSY